MKSMLSPKIRILAVLFFSCGMCLGQTAKDAFDDAYAAMKAENFDVAERKFEEGLKLDSENKAGRFGLGTLYIKLGEYRKALDLLEALIQRYPDDFFIKNNAAWIYATAEDYSIRNGERAVKLAQDALLSQPGSYHVWSTLSAGYYVLAEYEKAYRAANQALKLGIANRASADNIKSYQEQLEKCARAIQALSLIE